MNTNPKPGAWSFPLGLFAAFGIEMEYMIVDRESLDVRPVCDELFRLASGETVGEVEPDGPEGTVSWSNELALHVVELKTQRPATTLDGLGAHFQENINRIDGLLEPLGCRLLPTAMHPWMNPDAETRLWPHECNEIYRAYDRIFGCRGHGWGNLQSTHINLPFADEAEFCRLHAALRVALAILPALAASSPIVDGRLADHACHRMEVYRTNAKRIPMMTALVVPEPVRTRAQFETEILGKLYEDLRPFDPEGVLRHEFANARGAMARFDRGAIEIRVLDIQECPAADLAIAAFVIEIVRALCDGRWTSPEQQNAISTEALHAVLLQTITEAEHAIISDASFLAAFGIREDRLTAGELLAALSEQLMRDHPVWSPILGPMLSAGTLASRIRATVGKDLSQEKLRSVYRQLADCLHNGELFNAK